MGGSSSKEVPIQDPKGSAIPPPNPTPVHDENAPLPREKLPKALQKIVDNDDDSLFDQLYEGSASISTDSNVRYAAYAARARTILLSAQRYVAYTSDIGESFRPVAHPWLVRGAYGISWAYIIGDVSNEGYKAYLRQRQLLNPGVPGVIAENATDARDALGAGVSKAGVPASVKVPAIEDYKTVMVQRAIFQSLASMGLPAFTIHSVVRYSGRALKDAKNARIRTWGPIGLGLAAVPFLPYMFDKPVENAVEWTFHKAFETFGGPEAVGHAPKTGREVEMQKGNETRKSKEKEL